MISRVAHYSILNGPVSTTTTTKNIEKKKTKKDIAPMQEEIKQFMQTVPEKA